jgi:hypothetical protein
MRAVRGLMTFQKTLFSPALEYSLKKEAAISLQHLITEENDFKLWGYVKLCNVLFDHH